MDADEADEEEASAVAEAQGAAADAAGARAAGEEAGRSTQWEKEAVKAKKAPPEAAMGELTPLRSRNMMKAISTRSPPPLNA